MNREEIDKNIEIAYTRGLMHGANKYGNINLNFDAKEILKDLLVSNYEGKIESETEGVKIKFKKVNRIMPVCPNCDEVLIGNNSELSSFTCYNCELIWKVKSWGSPLLYISKPL